MAPTMGNLVLLIISAATGLFALIVQIYMVGFIMDKFVPISVDHSPKWHTQLRLKNWPLLNNFILLLLFSLMHSSMPRGPFRKAIRFCLSDGYYLPLYTFVSSLLILMSFCLWVPIPSVLWDIQLKTLRNTIYGVSALCWIGMSVSMLYLDPLGLLGIRDPLYQLLGWKKKDELVKTGLYSLMRHPIYSFLILSVWITPTMTFGHLLLSVMFTGYILVAVHFYEEPDLVNKLGPEYVEYMKSTPAYIPAIPFLTKTKKA